jgi:hypothetical protein
MLTAADLGQFTGTEGYTRYLGGLLLTDGVRYLAEQGSCFWFIDIIASYQPEARKDPALREMQFWKLTVKADKSAVVTCDDGNGKVSIKQAVPFTDFPLPEAKVWVEYGSVDGINPAYIALLPSEH